MAATSAQTQKETCLTDTFSLLKGYLEQQRKWAESSAVRDLEFEGDTTMKELANKCDSLKSTATRFDRDASVARRVQLADTAVEGLKRHYSHWMMDAHEDPLGRKILLVPNKGRPVRRS